MFRMSKANKADLNREMFPILIEENLTIEDYSLLVNIIVIEC